MFHSNIYNCKNDVEKKLFISDTLQSLQETSSEVERVVSIRG